MKFKKLLAVALAAATVGCSCAFSASAADNSTDVSKTLNVKAGQVVTLKLYGQVASGNTLISGIQTTTAYDSSCVSYTTETIDAAKNHTLETELTKGYIDYNPYYEENVFSLGLINYGEGTDLGKKTLLTSLDFDVTSAGLTSFNSRIDEMTQQDDDATIITENGKISMRFFIDGFELGDVDQSGKITVADAVMIQKHIANVITMDELKTSLADTDGNGKITVADAVMIQKYIANIIAEL